LQQRKLHLKKNLKLKENQKKSGAKFIVDNTKVDQQFALLAQLYIMDDSKTVEAFLESKGAKAIAFTRFEVGEGIEKAETDFAAEVEAAKAGL
jgi:elongation factor Ts